MDHHPYEADWTIVSTAEEQFSATIEGMQSRVTELQEDVDEAERNLGSVYANNPHDEDGLRSGLSHVMAARAAHTAVASMLQLAMGYRTGAYQVPDKQ